MITVTKWSQSLRTEMKENRIRMMELEAGMQMQVIKARVLLIIIKIISLGMKLLVSGRNIYHKVMMRKSLPISTSKTSYNRQRKSVKKANNRRRLIVMRPRKMLLANRLQVVAIAGLSSPWKRMLMSMYYWKKKHPKAKEEIRWIKERTQRAAMLLPTNKKMKIYLKKSQTPRMFKHK